MSCMDFWLACVYSTLTYFEGRGESYALSTETAHYSSDLRCIFSQQAITAEIVIFILIALVALIIIVQHQGVLYCQWKKHNNYS